MFKQITSFLATITIASAASAGFATASITDVTAQPSGLNATAAYGNVSGNDKPADVYALINASGADVFGTGLTWSLAGKSDDGGNGPFTSNPETTAGKLTFDSPATGAFVLSLKASNYFSLYYFDASFAGTTSIDFNTIGTSTNNKGKAQGLSHASLFTANGTPTTAVPSPTAAIAGLGLMGLLVSRRRRRA